jgi:hypothetical protein
LRRQALDLCKQLLNPEAYLRDILTKIADVHTINRIDELVPWRMAAAITSPPP